MFILELIKKQMLKKAVKNGLVMGGGCRILGRPNFGSEPWLIEIGNNVTVTSGVHFITHDGGTKVFTSAEKYKNVIKYGKIIIEDNCFVGINSIIMPGVRIGKNSVVGAGSVVTKSVPDNMVVAGNPAKVICTVEEYAERAYESCPEYNIEEYKQNKVKVVKGLLEDKMKF